MTLGSTVIVLFLFLLTGMLVMRPFLVGAGSDHSEGAARYDSLLAEKERLFTSIEELDLSLELEKISPEEHAHSREAYLRQAARILRDLDDHPLSEKLKNLTDGSFLEDEELERMIAERRKEIAASQSDLCPSCGQPVQEGDRFCSHCGGAL